MDYALEEIGNTLKEARERKGLSQRTLSELASVPQAQISKIENGSVDLKVSTLLKLARTLDLEPVLAPRKSLPAVNSIVRNARTGQFLSRSNEWKSFFSRALDKLSSNPERTDYAQLSRTLRELEHLSPVLEKNFRNRINPKEFAVWLRNADDEKETRHLLLVLRNLRNEAAHGVASIAPEEEVRPAYSLDEDDNA